MQDQVNVEEEPPGQLAHGKLFFCSLPQKTNQIVSGTFTDVTPVTSKSSDTFVEANSLGLSGANLRFNAQDFTASSNLGVFSYDLVGCVNSNLTNLLLEVSHSET